MDHRGGSPQEGDRPGPGPDSTASGRGAEIGGPETGLPGDGRMPSVDAPQGGYMKAGRPPPGIGREPACGTRTINSKWDHL